MSAFKTANLWGARVVPFVLAGITAYCTYVMIGEVGYGYCIAPQTSGYPGVAPRPGAAGVIIAIFSLLLIPLLATYGRIIQTVFQNPGFIPLSDQYHEQQKDSRRPKRRRHRRERGDAEKGRGSGGGGGVTTGTRYEATRSHERPSPASEQPGLVDFYSKDVFVCEGDGRPPWCTTCMGWKPDRTHHCREVGRCVRRMDHFCPWVAGVVSETNFKFFVQFCAYTVLITSFSIAVLAWAIAEQVSIFGVFDIHLPICMVFVGLFDLFCMGMVAISMRYSLQNLTNIEDLSAKVKVWTLAVYLPNPPAPNEHPPYQTITYPLIVDPDVQSSKPTRTFAILHSDSGENPFDLGPFENFKNLMGETIWDWLLPLHYSPFCDHSGSSDFPLGPAFERMKERAGILPLERESEKRHHHRRRRSSTRRTTTERQHEPTVTEQPSSEPVATVAQSSEQQHLEQRSSEPHTPERQSSDQHSSEPPRGEYGPAAP